MTGLAGLSSSVLQANLLPSEIPPQNPQNPQNYLLEYAEGQDDTYEWDNLTHAQHRALVALISEPKMQDAAKKAGIGRNTLYKWLRQPDFQAAYRKARQQAMTEATATLQRHSTDAANVLAEVMNNKDGQDVVRVTAARSVLDFSARFTKDELCVGKLVFWSSNPPWTKAAHRYLTTSGSRRIFPVYP